MTLTTPGYTLASTMLAEPQPTWLGDWGRFAAEFRWSDADEDLKAQTRLVLLDCLGTIAAGMQEPECRALATRLARNPGGGIAVGAGVHLHAGDAAFLNGVAGTMLELDEGNSFARGHPGMHVLPVLLAGMARTDGAGFLRAFLLGYEAGARVGASARLRTTLHPHGTWGTIGAAIAASAVENADADDMIAAFNVSASLGLGSSLRAMLEGATVRNAYAGIAARNGLYARDLVATGFSGEIDGVRSVYSSVLAEGFDPETMIDSLGSRWEIQRNYFKRHAACRFTHGALDVVKQLIQEHGPVDADQVDRIEVKSYVMAAQLDAPEPRNMLGAKFSVPFAIATTLVNGAATVQAFRAPALTDPRIIGLAARVTVTENAAYTAMLPVKRPAFVAIQFRDGRRIEGETMTNRGDAADPYSPAEIVDKFMDLAAPVWSRDHARALHRAVDMLDTEPEGLVRLHDLLAAPPKEM